MKDNEDTRRESRGFGSERASGGDVQGAANGGRDGDFGTEAERRVTEMLDGLGQVELPAFYRTRLLARLRAEERAARRGAWLRSPAFAWTVTAVCVATVVVLAVTGRIGEPTTRVGQHYVTIDQARSSIDPITPVDSSVVGAGDVEIVAAIDPPIEGGLIRLYVDDVDVTGLAEVTESYIMYSPGERFAEGEHIITIEIRDESGARLSDRSWLFYALDSRETTRDDRV